MKPLIVLIAVFGISLLLLKMITGSYHLSLAGRIAMAAMLLFTAIGHFAFTKGMALMIPEPIPFKTGLVYLTGILEIAGAAGLLIPGLEVTTAWLLIIFFVMLLPANIHAALKGIDLERAATGGPGPRYLYFRIPLQALFIAWVYYFGIFSG